MPGVSTRAFGMHLEVLKRADIPLEEFVRGLPLATSRLMDANERISWDAWCALCERLEVLCGGTAGLERAGAMINESGTLAFFIRAMGLFANPKSLYWASDRWLGPTLFPMMQTRYEELDDGRVRHELTIPEPYRDCPQFFHLNVGAMRAAPRRLGLPDSLVEYEIGPRRAVYFITPPPSMALWSRLRRAATTFLAARAAIDELGAQTKQLHRQLRALRREREQADEARAVAETQRQLAEAARAEADAARKVAEDASRLKTQFLTNISHELRTPLNAILGLTGLVLDEELPPTVRDDLLRVRRAGSSLLTLVNDLLDISRIEAGRMELQEIELDLETLLGGVLDAFRQAALEHDVALACRVASDVPTRVVGDPGRLRQVLTNLIGNGLKFTPPGGEVRLVVTYERHEDGPRFCFEISDTGPGIAEKERERIFEPFVQADGSTARRHGGTGLGLSIARDLVTLLGGSLTVESEIGRGSRFTVRLPLTLAPDVRESVPLPAALQGRRALLVEEQHLLRRTHAEERHTPEAHVRAREEENAPSPAGGRVLVVDDDIVNQMVMVRQLKYLGVEAITASGGLEALEALERGAFRAVFMDCQMPDLDGYETTRRWRERERTRGGRVPIIAVTAHAMVGDRERCLACGMDDYLPKPVSRAGLEAVLQTWGLGALGNRALLVD